MARINRPQPIKSVHETDRCVICGEIAGFGFGPPGIVSYENRVNKTKWYCNEHKGDGEKVWIVEFPTQAHSAQPSGERSPA